MSPRRDDSSEVLSDDQLEEEADEEVDGGAPFPQAVVSHFHVRCAGASHRTGDCKSAGRCKH